MNGGLPATARSRPAFPRLRKTAARWRRTLAEWAFVAEAAARRPGSAARTVILGARIAWSSGFRLGASLQLGGAFLYPEWIRRYDTLSPLDRERIRARIDARTDWPVISFVMTVHDPAPHLLDEAIRSMRQQLYPNWEICIADDASTDPGVRKVIERHASEEPRLKAVYRTESGQIAVSTNSALALAQGEFLAFVDHDGMVAEQALYWIAEELRQHPETDVVYSDSDWLDASGQRVRPHFKSNFDLEFLLGRSEVSRLSVYRRSRVQAIGGMRPNFAGSEDYDLALRILAASPAHRVRHVPAVLYHAREAAGAMGFAAADGGRNSEAARKAVTDFLAAKEIAADVLPAPGMPSGHRIRYRLPDPAPHVSIVVPTKNRAPLLRQAMTGVLGQTDYPRFDVAIADNGSDDAETLALFAELERDERVRVLSLPGSFNFSALNNAAVQQTRGDVLAFLNNDIAISDPGWLTEMVSRAAQSDVGAVGAKLYYPNGRIQHAGVVLGMSGVAGHWFGHAPGDFSGPMGELRLAREAAAVTAACMVVRRSVFEEVGGFDALHLAVEFNDVDFCLRLRERGYRVIWTPFAELIHHESASRRTDREASNWEARKAEAAYMRTRWGDQIREDPFFNPNLSYRATMGGFAMPPRVKRRWDV